MYNLKWKKNIKIIFVNPKKVLLKTCDRSIVYKIFHLTPFENKHFLLKDQGHD